MPILAEQAPKGRLVTPTEHPDAHSFYASLLKHEGVLPPAVAAQLKAMVEEGEPTKGEDDDIPLVNAAKAKATD